MGIFIVPTIISTIAIFAVYLWGGPTAFVFTLILVVLEITLSFDNAIVNAKILKEMSLVWQKRFLTWGILLAVFFTRLVLPILLVSIVASVSPLLVAKLALYDPDTYSTMLTNVDTTIKAFGGAFLMMVSLKYFFNVGKRVHWFSLIESRLAKWGRVESIEIAVALILLLTVSFLSHESTETILVSGLIGVILFTLTEGVAHGLDVEAKDITRSGAILFAYLSLIDTAFSLDGVIAAFAITNVIPVIFVGLGIGAYFVRTITVYLVHKNVLSNLIYLEHGAHWAVFGLGLAMLLGLIIHIPQVVVAIIGVTFVLMAYISSKRNFLRVEVPE